jgi:uncharacterized protein YkwD
MRRKTMTSAVCYLLGLFAIANCASVPPETTQPAFYDSLARAEAQLNVPAAVSLISDYRVKNGLPAVQADERLNAMATAQAKAMAQRNQVTHDPGGRGFTKRLAASGFNAKGAAENVGAGYHTLAEAFSGWRDSPSHNKNMLLPGATRIGIATAYAPNSKYKVFWALVLAEPDGAR